MAGLFEAQNDTVNSCPCSQGAPVQSFIGDDYSVNLLILLIIINSTLSIPLIHCGMVKDVVVLKVIVVQFLVFHGSIRYLILPQMTTLS
uniref:Uncharacterized protein n=1 Tax=Amphimedon queenslandica TaxID=400682 RepID=A0A1X7TPT8_AMPQE